LFAAPLCANNVWHDVTPLIAQFASSLVRKAVGFAKVLVRDWRLGWAGENWGEEGIGVRCWEMLGGCLRLRMGFGRCYWIWVRLVDIDGLEGVWGFGRVMVRKGYGG